RSGKNIRLSTAAHGGAAAGRIAGDGAARTSPPPPPPARRPRARLALRPVAPEVRPADASALVAAAPARAGRPLGGTGHPVGRAADRPRGEPEALGRAVRRCPAQVSTRLR